MESSVKDRQESPIPADAGLPQGRRVSEPEERPPTEMEAVDAAAQGTVVTRSMEEVLLGHFFENEPAAGETTDDATLFAIDIGGGREMSVWLRPIEWAEWQEAQTNARKKDGTVDEFHLASWVVAYTIVNSPLGRILARVQEVEKEHAPKDAAGLLRRYFKRKSGSLLAASRAVIASANLQVGTEAVREIEAGKP